MRFAPPGTPLATPLRATDEVLEVASADEADPSVGVRSAGDQDRALGLHQALLGIALRHNTSIMDGRARMHYSTDTSLTIPWRPCCGYNGASLAITKAYFLLRLLLAIVTARLFRSERKRDLCERKVGAIKFDVRQIIRETSIKREQI